MNSLKSWWKVIGLILWESIAIIDLGIDLYTGEMSPTEFFLTLSFCLTMGVLLYYIIKRRTRKK